MGKYVKGLSEDAFYTGLQTNRQRRATYAQQYQKQQQAEEERLQAERKRKQEYLGSRPFFQKLADVVLPGEQYREAPPGFGLSAPQVVTKRPESPIVLPSSFIQPRPQTVAEATGFGVQPQPQTVAQAAGLKPVEETPRPISPERSFMAGIGDILTSAGGAAQWLGAEGIGERLARRGAGIQEKYGPKEGEEESFGGQLVRTLPFSLTLLPIAGVGATGGAMVSRAVGATGLARGAIMAAGAGVSSRVAESAMEAGGTYEQAKAMGMTEEEAKRAATETYRKNLPLAALDVPEFAVAFLPVPPAVKRIAKIGEEFGTTAGRRALVAGGRLALTGGMEAGEEMLQEVAQQQALGQPVTWEGVKQPGLIGGAYGVLMGGAGAAYDVAARRQRPEVAPEETAPPPPEETGAEPRILTPKDIQTFRGLIDVMGPEEGRKRVAGILEDMGHSPESALRLADNFVTKHVAGAEKPTAADVRGPKVAPEVAVAPETEKKKVPEVKPAKFEGWYTPVIPGKELTARSQGSGLPAGRFIALDKPFESDAHDASKAKRVTVDVENVFDPDGLISPENVEKHRAIHREMVEFLNKKSKESQPKTVEEFQDYSLKSRQLMTDFLKNKGFDAYIRGIDGDPNNRELIVFDKGKVKEEVKPAEEEGKPPVVTERPKVEEQTAEAQGEAPKAPEAAKEPWEMSREELKVAHKKAKYEEENSAVIVFGEEGAKKYKRLYQAANSTLNPRKADEAAKELAKMESNLTPEQERILFGIGKEGANAEELNDYIRALDELDWESPQALGKSLRWAVTKVGTKENPSQMLHTEKVAYAQLKAAFKFAQEHGWDTKVVSDAALKAAAARFGDKEDAAFVLKRFLKNEPDEREKAVVETPKALGAPKEPYLMTKEEFRRQETQGKYNTIVDAIKAGKPVQVRTQYRATPLTSPEHVRLTQSGTVQTREGSKWVNLVDAQVDDLAAQAGMKIPAFEDRVYHRDHVEQALEEGKLTPEEAERLGHFETYPELREKYGGKGEGVKVTEKVPEKVTEQKPEEKPAEAKPAAKEPYQMTREEYNKAVDEALGQKVEDYAAAEEKRLKTSGHPVSKEVIIASMRNHRDLVERALSEGKPVPPEVLKDYPDLAEKYGEKAPETEPGQKPSPLDTRLSKAGWRDDLTAIRDTFEAARKAMADKLNIPVEQVTDVSTSALVEEFSKKIGKPGAKKLWTELLQRATEKGLLPTDEIKFADTRIAGEMVHVKIGGREETVGGLSVVGKAKEPKVAETPTAETGKPFKATLYRGEGKPKSEIYTIIEKPVLGKGLYLAFNEADARFYGEKISKIEVSLENPLVIKTDDDWRAVTRGWANTWQKPHGMTKEQVSEWIDRIKEAIVRKGHDGVIIQMSNRAETSTLRNVFGHDQVVSYKKEVPEAEIRLPAEAGKEVALGQPEKVKEEISGRPETREKKVKVGETPTGRPPVSRIAIINYIEEKLKLPIREGRLTLKKAAGEYKQRQEVARTKRAEDLQVIAHETGHHITKVLGLDYKKYAELEALGAELYPNATPSMKRREGLAEFFRFYLVKPARAQESAPTFYKDFEARLDEEPEIGKAIREVQTMYQDWYRQGARYRIRGAIVRRQAQDPRNFLSKDEQVYADWKDDLKAINTFVHTVSSAKELDFQKNPYIIARLARGRTRKAVMLLERAMVTPDGRIIGESLEEILKPVRKNILEFTDYLVAKRSVELHKRGKKTGIDPDDAIQGVQEFEEEFPEFIEAQKKLVEYQDNLLDYLVDAGVISEEKAKLFRKLNKDYVPFYRFFGEESATEGFLKGGGKKWVDLPQPVKAIKGSTRSIIDPIESIVKNTIFLIDVAERNRVGREVANLADQAEGMGWLIEKVPTPVQPTKVELERLRKELIEAGVDESALDEADLERVAVIFSPVRYARFKEKRENILVVHRDGKPEFYQVHPDLYRALEMMDAPSANWFIRLLSFPTTLLRTGAILNPEFIARNWARDQLTAFIQSKYGYKPVVDLLRGLYHVLGKTETYIKWEAAGGAQATLTSLDRDYLQGKVRQLTGQYTAKDRAKGIISSPIRVLQFLSESLEEATRVGEFAKGLEAERARPVKDIDVGGYYSVEYTGKEFYGKVIKKGKKMAEVKLEDGKTIRIPLPGEHATWHSEREAMARAGFASREVSLDFQRAGFKGRQANQMVAFFNAALEGPDKFARAFREDPAGMTIRTALLVTLPSIAIFLKYHDDERYKQLPRWRKDLYWCIPPEDKSKPIIFIPKPFEIGVLFGSFFERMLAYEEEKNPKEFKDWAYTMGTVWWPDAVPNAFIPYFEAAFNYSFFLQRPIVPMREQHLEAAEQYGSQTSEVAKFIGRTFNVSPRKIEHVVRGYAGGLGMHGLRLLDLLTGKWREKEELYEAAPFVRAFAGAPYRQAESIEEFYAELDKLSKRVNTWKEKQRRGEEPGPEPDFSRYSRFNYISRQLSHRREEIREIQASKDLSPEEKRKQIDAVNIEMINLAREALGQEPIEQVR